MSENHERAIRRAVHRDLARIRTQTLLLRRCGYEVDELVVWVYDPRRPCEVVPRSALAPGDEGGYTVEVPWK